MKRFSFKLQAVLTLRQRVEQAALERYGRAMQQRQAAIKRLSEVEMQLSDSRRCWLNALGDGCPAAQAAQMVAYCKSLEEQRMKGEEAVHLAEAQVTQASVQMILARQQREAVEKYFTRQRANHEQLVRIEERKLMDDLIGRRPVAPPAEDTNAPTSWHST